MPKQPISLTYLKSLEIDTLLDITNAINRQIDEDSLLKIFLFTVVANFKIEKLLVYSRELNGWQPVLKHNVSADELIPNIHFQKIYKQFDFIYIKKGEEYGFLSNQFEVCIPIGRNNKNIGFIFLKGLNKIDSTQLNESLKFIQTIANIITVAIQNIRLNKRKLEQQAIKKEIELARKIQSKLFPASLPINDRLKIFANYIPQYEVGGDYFDYIKINENEFYLCIADVSGKGVSAAFIMSNIQAALRILAKKKYPITEIVHDINELVYFNYKGEKFVTFFLAHYNLEDNSIQYINCGHNGPIFYQENKGFTLLEEGTVPLGAFEQIHSLSKGHIQDIKGKSILFSYTDGLVEAFDSMDTNRSLDIIKNCILQTKQEWKLNAEVLDKLQIKSNNFDDITILSCFVNHV